MFDEYFNLQSVVSTSNSAATLPPLDITRASPSSTSIDKDAPSLCTSQNIETTTSSINSTNVEQPYNEEVVVFDSDTFTNPFAPLVTSSAELSSWIVDTTNMHTFQQPHVNTKRWTKDHQLVAIISNPSKPISTRCQLATDALWCYFHAFLVKEEPKNYKEAMKESSWIEAMQDEIHEFERLKAKPTEKYLTVVKLVFRYLKGINIGLGYPMDTRFDLTAFADANHAYCQDLRNSTSGNPMDAVSEQVENEIIELYLVKTAYQLADIFTKTLIRERFKFLVKHLGMQSITPEELKLLTESEGDEE
ncbi:hypothetical protein Tco_1177930 [Tanacetum coccineum]